MLNAWVLSQKSKMIIYSVFSISNFQKSGIISFNWFRVRDTRGNISFNFAVDFQNRIRINFIFLDF